jgi:integrase/recombinase XerD
LPKGSKFEVASEKLLRDLIKEYKAKSLAFRFESIRKHKYTDRGVRKMLARYAAQAGITRSMSPHKWRHFLFTWLKKEGIDDGCTDPTLLWACHTPIAGNLLSALLADAQPSYNAAMEHFPIQ